MIYAVISDIHANVEALTACFEEIEKINPDRIICLGDLVDYCAEPNEAIKLVKQKCDIVILGNHDEAQFHFGLAEGWTENAHVSSLHTREALETGCIDYLKGLPYFHSENNIRFVHASPYFPEEYRYILKKESAEINFMHFTEQICFIGHSHKPVIYELKGSKVRESGDGILDQDSRYIINVGSTGQPRDGNPKASFGILDTEKSEYRNIRVEYDIKAAANKIIKEGLPEILASRLYLGI